MLLVKQREMEESKHPISQPLVTVIMAVYNTARYVRESILSVVGQTTGEWELIVIDDGSTDQSKTICDDMARQDRRIVVVHKPNSGQADSRNIAIGMARGEYVFFIDSDDWIAPTTLEHLLDRQELSGADAVVCSYYEEYRKSRVHIHNEFSGVFSRQEAIDIYYYCKNKTTYMIWGVLFSRALLQAPIPQLRFCEDTAIILQWISQADIVAITDEPLYHYRMRQSSVMHIEKEAERARANLKAFQLRNRFCRAHKLLPQQAADAYDAQTYLYVTKQFVRQCTSAARRNDIARTASEMLRELMPVDMTGMKRRTRRRIQLLARHPVRFAWQLYLSQFFTLKKSDEERHGDLFE